MASTAILAPLKLHCAYICYNSGFLGCSSSSHKGGEVWCRLQGNSKETPTLSEASESSYDLLTDRPVQPPVNRLTLEQAVQPRWPSGSLQHRYADPPLTEDNVCPGCIHCATPTSYPDSLQDVRLKDPNVRSMDIVWVVERNAPAQHTLSPLMKVSSSQPRSQGSTQSQVQRSSVPASSEHTRQARIPSVLT